MSDDDKPQPTEKPWSASIEPPRPKPERFDIKAYLEAQRKKAQKARKNKDS